MVQIQLVIIGNFASIGLYLRFLFKSHMVQIQLGAPKEALRDVSPISLNPTWFRYNAKLEKMTKTSEAKV
jgi:hypothetical protein